MQDLQQLKKQIEEKEKELLKIDAEVEMLGKELKDKYNVMSLKDAKSLCKQLEEETTQLEQDYNKQYTQLETAIEDMV